MPWAARMVAHSSATGRSAVPAGGGAGGIEQLGDDGGALLRRLAGPVYGLGQVLAEGAMVVDAGEAQVGVGQAAQPLDGLVGGDGAHLDGVEQPAQSILVHVTSMLPRGCWDEWGCLDHAGT